MKSPEWDLSNVAAAACVFLAAGAALALALALSAAPARATDEPDELAAGKVVVIKSSGRLAKFVAKPRRGGAFDLPNTPANDPITHGGMLHIFDTVNPRNDNTYNLPAGLGWKGLGKPAGSKGFKYKGAKTLADPCAVLLRRNLIKAVCKGRAVTLDPPFDGNVGIVLTVGTGSKRYCASFGGSTARNVSGELIRKAAPPRSACESPPKLCAPLTTWVIPGSGDGQFGEFGLWGVATDASGNVYVADTDNHRIQKFDGGGTFLTNWGSGSGAGQFLAPLGVATDATGNVYVADIGRIQKFDGSGAFLTEWGTPGGGDGQFLLAWAVATDTSGNVYVADIIRIQKFDGSGTFLTKWGAFGVRDGRFFDPQGVATDASGNVYVADTGNHRIQKFDGSGTFLTKWGAFGGGDGQFVLPRGLATDASGNVYVADENHRIQKFDGAGAFLTKWGTHGSGNGEFGEAGPAGVATDASGNVYVADPSNHRIQKFFACP